MKNRLSLFILIVLALTFVPLVLIADGMEPEANEKKELEIVTVMVKDSQLIAHFVIPENMHLTLQKDYFYLDVENGGDVDFEATVYPQGHEDEDGYINFEKEVTLTRNFKLAENVKPSDVKIIVYAAYQYCYETYCEPPEEVEFEIDLTEGNK